MTFTFEVLLKCLYNYKTGFPHRNSAPPDLRGFYGLLGCGQLELSPFSPVQQTWLPLPASALLSPTLKHLSLNTQCWPVPPDLCGPLPCSHSHLNTHPGIYSVGLPCLTSGVLMCHSHFMPQPSLSSAVRCQLRCPARDCFFVFEGME